MPKNTLTFEEKVAAGFEEAGDRMDEIDGRIKESATEIKALRNQIRKFTAAFMTGITPEGKPYSQIWPTEEHAREFAKLFLVAAGKMAISGLSKDMSEGVSSAGGVLVPDELKRVLIDLLPRYGKFRANALRFPIGGGITTVPQITSDLEIYCPGEGTAPTKSQPIFKGIKLTPKNLLALCVISMELDEDSFVGLGEILGMSFVRSMAKKEDLIGFLGDGTEAYFGMTGIVGKFLKISDTVSSIAGLHIQAVAGVWSALTLGDFESVVSLLPEEFDDNAKWYCNKRFYWKVMHAIAADEGVSNMFEILTNRKEKYFLGYPVEYVSSMPGTANGDQIVAVLGDLQMGAYLGERREIRIERSDQAYFGVGQVGFRASERIDINIFGCGDTTNPGPIVGLITDAS